MLTSLRPCQGLILLRMARLGILLGLLMAACFTFCLGRKDSVSMLPPVEGALWDLRKPPCHHGCCGSFLQKRDQGWVTAYVSFFPLPLRPLASFESLGYSDDADKLCITCVMCTLT